MKTLYNYICDVFENDNLAEFNVQIDIHVNLDRSAHAEERQTRHGELKGQIISDEDIISSVKKCSKDIIKNIINNNIDVYGRKSRFIIRDKNTKLNIVCQAHKTDNPNVVNIDVVTVIRVNKFWNTKDNFTIVI